MLFRTLLLALALVAGAAAKATPPCTLTVTPLVLMLPGQYNLHLKAHLTDPKHWWVVTEYLVSGDTAVHTSQLCEGDSCQVAPNTFNRDWNVSGLGQDSYEVQLIAVARDV